MPYVTRSHVLDHLGFYLTDKLLLSNDVASGSDITPYNKIDNPLVVYRFSYLT